MATPDSKRSRSDKVRPARWVGAALGVGAAAVLMSFGGLAVLAATTVSLGTATSFAVLAGTTVTNTGSSTISGDLGVDPGSAVVGAPLVEAPYSTFTADSVALGAKNDLTTAYNQAATGEGTATQVGTNVGDLTGLTLTSGVYQTGTIPGTPMMVRSSLLRHAHPERNGRVHLPDRIQPGHHGDEQRRLTGTASQCDVLLAGGQLGHPRRLHLRRDGDGVDLDHPGVSSHGTTDGSWPAPVMSPSSATPSTRRPASTPRRLPTPTTATTSSQRPPRAPAGPPP